MSNYRKKNQQTVLEVIVLGIFKLIADIFRLAFKGWSRKRGLTTSEKNEIIYRRNQVEAMIQSNNIHELRQAVFEADKLVDHLLQSYGYAGNSMGERLRSAQQYIDRSTYDGIWQGHKVRNQLAHEHNIEVNQYELRAAADKLLKYIRSI